MFQHIRRNFWLKLLALALAVTAWAYFHYSAAPSITAHFDQEVSVPVLITGLAPGLTADGDVRAVSVTLEAPRNRPPARADELQAVVDLSEHSTVGVVSLPIRVVAPDLHVRSVVPSTDTLIVDRAGVRSLPASVSYSGVSRGIVVTSIRLDPARTTVRGNASVLAKVAEVKLDVPMAAGPGAMDLMVRPVAVDASGVSIPNVRIAPNLVRVRATFASGSTSEGAH